MASSYTIPKASSYSTNWDAVARYYTDLYYEYEKKGDTAGMQAAYNAGESARDKLTGTSSTNTVSIASSAPSSKTSQVSVSAPSPTYMDYSSYYYDSGYSGIEAQAQALYDAQVQSSVNALSQQKQSINQSADELARQAYIAYLRSRETMPQQLVAMGYNGGLSESRQVALEAGWQDRRNQIGIERDNAIFAIDGAINDAYANGQAALADQLIAIRSQAQSQWNDYVRRQEETSLDNYWKQASLDNENYWNQVQLSYDQMARQQQLLYQQSRDKVTDTRLDTQFSYQQNQDKAKSEWDNLLFEYQKSQNTAKSEWDNLMFEYQQKQDSIQNALKQQQMLLNQMEAARKAVQGK